MAKIGRNEQCPCGSGRKYKHCCLVKEQAGVQPKPQSAEQALKVSLKAEIAAIQQAASEKKKKIRELGVFVLLATKEGDAWLLEITDSDCVQLAKNGEVLDVPIDENSETIEINWSHTYRFKEKCFTITAYADKEVTQYSSYPSKEINSSVRRLLKKFPKEMLNKVHLNS